MILAAVLAVCLFRARDGSFRVRVNAFALAGALLAFISFATGWYVISRGSDWSISSDYSLFLLFTYPIAVVTPLAGIGQAGVLLWVIDYARDHDASITPFYGYLIAWISVMLMLVSIAWPVGFPRDSTKSDIYDRLLTLTFRQSSGHWMSTRNTVLVLYALVSGGVGAVSISSNSPDAALAVLFVGFIFVWLILGRESRSPQNDAGSPMAKTGVEVAANTAWVLYVALAYLALMVAIETATGAFGRGDSGEEKTRALVLGMVALAVVIPLALVARHRATPPRLPRDLMLFSVAFFILFIMLASLALSQQVHTGISSRGSLVLAGIGLVGPAFLYVQAQSENGKRAGD